MDKNYYSSLLILQYANKLKAKATVELEVSDNCQLVNNIYYQLINAFTIEKAVGKQLDLIGVYIGQVRTFNITFFYKLFAYANPNGTIQTNGVGYSSPTQTQEGIYVNRNFLNNAIYEAPDNVFKFFIKLKLAKNSGRNTDYSIGNVLNDIFNGNVVMFDNRNMSISYLLLNQIDLNVRVILAQNKFLLPTPAGVNINLITNVPTNNVFGYADPRGNKANYLVGYSSPNQWQEGTYISPDNFI